jgi:dihydroorotate dehydrogenase (NAD+) catalytic subunit
MASASLNTTVGGIRLSSPLIAASGTVGSVWEWAEVADVDCFGAAVAKSVSAEPWAGRPVPRLAPTTTGMLNGIGIQNPGIESWVDAMAPHISGSKVPIWGSAVGHTTAEYAKVAARLGEAGVPVVELNLSCPNLDDGEMFSFDPRRASSVVEECAGVSVVPVGAKLSPDTPDLVAVASACLDAGAAFLTLTNTTGGFGVEPRSRRPLLSGGVGGYSGPGLKPVSLRCVYQVASALPGAPIIGCGGISSATDVFEYLIAGASAVAIGTALLETPNAGRRIAKDLEDGMGGLGVPTLSGLVGTVRPW